jgi:hypothetical protein
MICSRLRRTSTHTYHHYQKVSPRRNFHLEKFISSIGEIAIGLSLASACATGWRLLKLKPLDDRKKARCQEIAKQLGVTRDVIYRSGRQKDGYHVIGLFKPVVVIPEPFCEFFVAHELGHVKHKDQILYPLAWVASIKALSEVSHLFNLPFWLAPPSALATVYAINCFFRYREKNADQIAAHTVDDQALSYGIRTFHQYHEEAKKGLIKERSKTAKLWLRMFYKKDDTIRSLLLTHPPLPDRISYLKEIYFQRFKKNAIYLELNDETIKIEPEDVQQLREIINNSENEKEDNLFDLQKITLRPDRSEHNVRFLSINGHVVYKTIDPDLIQGYLKLSLKNLTANLLLNQIVAEACKNVSGKC